MTATTELSLLGIKQGDPCWIVSQQHNGPTLPVAIPAVNLVAVHGDAKVLHEGRLYAAHEVFETEADAIRQARRSAAFLVAYHRERLAAAEEVVRVLGPEPEVTEEPEEEAS